MLCAAATSPPKKQTSTAPEEQKCEVRIRNPLGLDSTRFNPNWNVAPTHQVPALRRADPEWDAGGAGGGTDRGTELVALRWGLIPSWAKGVPPKFGTIMATCERLATAPTWRGPWRGRGGRGDKNGGVGQRCILPALGFYEWQAITDAAGRPGKQPWYIRVGDQPVFGMAGLWDASTRADGSVVESCAVITVPANAVMNVIDGTSVANGGTNDGRMPAILTVEAQEAWLHGSADEAFACLKPYSDELTIAWPVSTRVNSVKNNDERLVEEATVA